MRNLLNFKRSVAFRWVASYAIILIIPLATSAIIYLQTTRNVEYEIERANKAMLNQVKYIVDSELAQTERMAAQLSIDPNIRTFLELDRRTQSDHSYFIYETGQELGRNKSTSDFIRSINIYSNKLDKLLTSQTYADSGLFYEMMHQSEDYSYAQWRSDIREPRIKTYSWMPMMDNGKMVNSVVYLASLAKKANGEHGGTLIMPLNQNKIENLLEHVDWVNRGKVYIVNENDQVLFHNRNSGDFPELLDYAGKPDYMVTYIQSDIADWRYVSAFPADVFWERAREIRNLNLLGLLICCVIGAVVISYFARKNYNPVRELVHLFTSKKKGEAAMTDEYSFIRESVLSTIRERDDMNHYQLRQNKVLQSYYLARLLKGQTQQAMSAKEAMLKHGVHWKSDQFAVLLFYMQSGPEPGLPIHLSSFIVSNIVEDIVNRDRKQSIWFTDADGMLAAIVNIHPGREELWREDIEEAVAEAYEFIAQRYRLSFALSGSDMQASVEGIHRAFLEALEAQEYRLLLEENIYVWYSDIKPNETAYYYSINDEVMLMNLIKTGEQEKAVEWIERIVEDIFRHQAPIEMIKCSMIELASTIMKIIPKESQQTVLWEERKPLKRLLACSTRVEFRQELLELLDIVCGLIAEKLSMTSSAGIGERILEFVQAHYSDINLSVSMIGAHYGITPQYVSKLFKDHTGEGLHEFISLTRVREAKKLLDQDYSIDDTAMQVGYTSSSAFIRVFKKYEGITPGKYKAMQ